MALFRKFFYRKPPDGLLEIYDRVYGYNCDLPFTLETGANVMVDGQTLNFCLWDTAGSTDCDSIRRVTSDGCSN
ncbi:hypothetical protein Q3G72_031085 [Acer saccharum]|nr:hypothetical protein Q3G72_031085 [Acer saccharum]